MPIRAPPLARSSERRDTGIPEVTESSTPPNQPASFGNQPIAVGSAEAGFRRPNAKVEARPCPWAGTLDQMWWMGLGGPRSGRIVRPLSTLKSMGGKLTRVMGATISSAGSTAGSTEQKATAHVGAIAGEPGMSPCRGHAGQAFDGDRELFDATVSCGICMVIGTATAATLGPRSPVTKATSRLRARRRISVPSLIGPQIAPRTAGFKLGSALTSGSDACLVRAVPR